MSRVFITGSTDGLGLLAAKELIAQGHEVVLHARNESRKEDTLQQVVNSGDVDPLFRDVDPGYALSSLILHGQ